ncbi:MAG: mannosyl-3-phosphoglycerate synthase [Methanobacteriales archaeon]|nr:mannosyl-3-phosphoglycerate synthase [Methanobacteriaceae archaeon]MBC7096837.1 mannosyl-3-phosphoglycerate synthase [Methanobacteriales archaeon]
MLVERPKSAENIGPIKIYYPQRIIKLGSKSPTLSALNFPKESLDHILKDFSIIIPIKNEDIRLFDSAIRSIPSDCHIIVVSNSNKEKCEKEMRLIEDFHDMTGDPIIFAHQRDPSIGSALEDIGYTSILDNGLVRDGKGEGLIIGLLITKCLKRKYVGFVDADNYMPTSIYEYVLDFAIGIAMSQTPYSMVRLLWKYKPKAVGDKLHLEKWGRVSRITNKYLNLLLSSLFGYETSIIMTGNAGEHAMTMELAERLSYASGYSFEPYQLIHMLESADDLDLKEDVEIFQIETLSPHMHENKGEEHIKDMILTSLSTIYHSRLSNKKLQEKIIKELKEKNILKDDKPPKNTIISPIKDINAKGFINSVKRESDIFMELR